MARAGEGDVPARTAPGVLRPFLNFAKLPPRALVAARRALDADDAFRAHVVDEVSEEAVGRAGWLFLTRPEGWEADLDALTQRADDERARVADHRAEDDARRRLGAAEAVARRAEEGAGAARDEAGRAVAALADERRARRAATREATELAARVETMIAERDRAVVERDRAVVERDRALTVEAHARAEAATAKAEAAAASAEAATAKAAAASEAATARTIRMTADAGAAAVKVPRPAERQAPVERAPTAPPPPSVGSEGAGALASAADAARALGEALAAAALALGGGEGDAAARSPAASPTSTASAPGWPSPPSPRGRRPRATPRVAAPLPPAIFEESPEAAEHLARLPGVVILIDGYNVSHAGWPGTPIAEQRRRLVDALAELVARTGADVRVVFDGADTVDPPLVATTARPVRVSFSPPDVEADDVIVAEVGEIPAHRPVVVASSDNRVRDESRARGANLLRSSQLLVLLRR